MNKTRTLLIVALLSGSVLLSAIRVLITLHARKKEMFGFYTRIKKKHCGLPLLFRGVFIFLTGKKYV
jgi:hypothetical protein